MATENDKAILNSIFNPLLPIGECVTDENDMLSLKEEYETEEVKKSKEYENQGVKFAEEGDVLSALEMFTKAIEIAPLRSSGYNNRAQALRLKGDVTGALEDLNQAISLNSDGMAVRQAYNQRGLIYRLDENNEAAINDFQKAANLGSSFAKCELVKMNPYAALCNKMLGEVFCKIRKGERLESSNE